MRATTSGLYSQTRSINSPALLFRDCAFKRQKFSSVGLAFCTAALLVRSNGVRFSLCRDLFGCLDRVLDVTTGILNVVLLTMDKVFGCFVRSDLLTIVRYEWFLVNPIKGPSRLIGCTYICTTI